MISAKRKQAVGHYLEIDYILCPILVTVPPIKIETCTSFCSVFFCPSKPTGVRVTQEGANTGVFFFAVVFL